VDKVTKRGARSNSAKAPGPVAKVFMRALMPIMFRPSLVEKTLGAEYRARIDWDAPVSV
ncbi:MAG: FAD-dependent monooxygenase, partial [Mycobacteriaceae bacterium]|nr:FAD-dependent monooxygenase [Mycobacteriaceae bacterium]